MDFFKLPTIPTLKIQLYYDGADLPTILTLGKNPAIRGITTNPSLVRKAGVSHYLDFCRDVLSEVSDKPVSFEIFADDYESMKRQAWKLAGLGSHVFVKIPVTNSLGESNDGLIRELSLEGVQVNVTALFTFHQVLKVCEALRGGARSIISIFAGRIADSGVDPIPLVHAASQVCEDYGTIQLLWASAREVFNVMQAQAAGCHIITINLDLLKKLQFLGKDLTQLSLDVVKQFRLDAEAAALQL